MPVWVPPGGSAKEMLKTIMDDHGEEKVQAESAVHDSYRGRD